MKVPKAWNVCLAEAVRPLRSALAIAYLGVATSTHADDEYYMAVATSPPPDFTMEPGETGHYGIGWHTESHVDAGKTAVAECERQGGEHCSYNASGVSMRGGCVGLAIARWRDRDEELEQRTYLTTSSSFREHIDNDLEGDCRSAIFAGKYRDTVAEHSCEVVRVTCAADIGKPLASPSELLTTACSGWNEPPVEEDGGGLMGFFQAASADSVRACVAQGADPNSRLEMGVTPLMRAAHFGNTEAVGVLVAAGADPNAQAKGGLTALRVAVARELPDVVAVLLERGADVNARDEDDWTALHWIMDVGAQQEGTVGLRILRTLLQAGADPNARRGDGHTPLRLAVARELPRTSWRYFLSGEPMSMPETKVARQRFTLHMTARTASASCGPC